MTSPYHNRLPMAYLPASRAVESVGIPPMFRSRVRGMGIDLSAPATGYSPEEIARIKAQAKYSADMDLWEKTYGAAYGEATRDCPRCITAPCPCASADEFLKLHPYPVMEQVPVSTPAPTVPKPSAGLMGLPLILGAAYLLLS